MRQFAVPTAPRELLGAACIDGATELAGHWRIALPLTRLALGVQGPITFIGSWNNAMNPLIVMRSAENYTLSLAPRSLLSSTSTEWDALMAESVISTLPLLLLFVVSSRQMVAGPTADTVK
ncbi:hypothetical protein [Roseateles sp.]|uniref:hypothetical protein n=1 Tax=Roseateles sp. TaxID=1971397 RepID=UPI0025E2EEE6|nr:hypothetical protein [Roseateles sp.]MBV8034795.1 carbohydrate ABC transporter permease [Roseateles sp.]